MHGCQSLMRLETWLGMCWFQGGILVEKHGEQVQVISMHSLLPSCPRVGPGASQEGSNYCKSAIDTSPRVCSLVRNRWLVRL